jgi:hypothetical protein
MKKMLLVGLVIALCAGCTPYNAPNVQPKLDQTVVMGSIEVTGLLNGTAINPQPASMFMYLAKVSVIGTKNGLPILQPSERSESFTVQSAWQAPLIKGITPFFIPLEPGWYKLTNLKFAYDGNPIFDFELPVKNTVLFRLDKKADATFLGNLKIEITSYSDARKTSTAVFSLDKNEQAYTVYRATNPTKHVVEAPWIIN